MRRSRVNQARSKALKSYWRSVKSIAGREKLSLGDARTARRISREGGIPAYLAAALIKGIKPGRPRRVVLQEDFLGGGIVTAPRMILWAGREFPMSIFPDPMIEGKFNGVPGRIERTVTIKGVSYSVGPAGEKKRPIQETFQLAANATYSDFLSACYAAFRALYEQAATAGEGVDIEEISIQ